MRSPKHFLKKNLLKIPDFLANKVKSFSKDDFVVAAVKKISATDIISGKYSHLGIKLAGETPTFSNNLVPNRRVGKFSQLNVDGEEIIRKDLPKIKKSYSWNVPDYGDWSRGSHEVTRDREVYRRQIIGPKELEITIELLGKEIKDERLFVFKFCINQILNRMAKNYRKDFLFSLNLLQENIGCVDVFSNDASLDDYLKTIYVNWEILPPGERDNTIAKILSGFKAATPEIREKLIARYDLLAKLNPIAFINGTSGFRRYFGAKFTEELVVFENIEYGNAVYVMFDEWEKLSKLSRLDLLNSGRKDFVRIIHKNDWKSQLKKLVHERMESKN